jgi:hypothetical protein
MTEPVPEANDADRAEQSVPVEDPADDAHADGFSANTEADAADVLEQYQDAPIPDDDYDR